jgi:eukaryotic-like serine/threonine-protein kinase
MAADDSRDGDLGAQPTADELALAVTQAKIASVLFGAAAATAAPVVVGRYRLLEEVGRGGMGVVWGAWDPDLERRVAIKLLDPLKTIARARLVGEARALAKLSHPHVVPVYDVGVVDDRVYLVMEWIAGVDLRRHVGAEKRGTKAIVAVYLQAARGLEAVHAAGLVHRDFKPENALVGRDGRVRVVDFGLARGDVEHAREIAGTPRYMAPEQLAGEALTPAVDQFAFCVALCEALTAEPPRYVERVIARGTEGKAAARFPSMSALVAALERDPARRWRRAGALGLAGVAVAAAFVVGSRREDTTCSGPPPGTLDGQARGRALQHAETLGAFAAGAVPALAKRLDAAETSWRGEHRNACLAHARGTLTTTLYERRLTCLARAAATLDAASELVASATPASFPDALVAADAIVPAGACARVDRSLLAPPPADAERGVRDATAAIEQARLFATASHADAITRAVAARTAAEKTGYAPVIARGLLVEGRARMVLGDAGAAATLARAGRVALATADDATAVEAYARHAYVTATTTGRAPDGLDFVDVFGERLDPHEFARLLWLNNRAAVYGATGDPAASRRLLERALAQWRPDDGEDTAELVSIPHNLALVSERPADGRALIERARDELARRLGREHPQVLQFTMSSAIFIGDLAEARAVHDGACARLGALFPHLTGEITQCAYESAWLAHEAKDADATKRHARIAAANPNDPDRAAIAAVLAGDVIDLEPITRAAEKSDVPWARLAAADAYAVRGNWAAALDLLVRDGHVFSARRLARARAELAKQLAQSDPARARELAAAATAWYRDAGAPQ